MVASLPVGRTGLFLEVAESLAAPGAGLGLFLRKGPGISGDVIMFGGQALCGYGTGELSDMPIDEGGKTILITFESLDSKVFFRGELQSMRTVLGILGTRATVAGHILERDEDTEAPVSIAPDPDYVGECKFYIPADETGPPPQSLMDVGKFCNDLAIESTPNGQLVVAGGGSKNADSSTQFHILPSSSASYSKAADQADFIVLTHHMKAVPLGDGDVDEQQPLWCLMPQAPILTLSRSMRVFSESPVELGCRYGFDYWKDLLVCSEKKHAVS